METQDLCTHSYYMTSITSSTSQKLRRRERDLRLTHSTGAIQAFNILELRPIKLIVGHHAYPVYHKMP